VKIFSNTQRFPFRNILAVMFKCLYFIFSKVLAVLDWELSTLGEDLKYYANFSIADSLIYKYLIVSLKVLY
jgi:hypothetical protein